MCSVVRCDSWRRRAQRFILPDDPEKRLEWVQFLFEVNGQRLKESSWTDIRVCSEHFARDCFLTVIPAAGSARLKSDAVPSVYEPGEPDSKQLSEKRQQYLKERSCKTVEGYSTFSSQTAGKSVCKSKDPIQLKGTACESDQLKISHSPIPGSSALKKEETSSLIGVPASPASSEVSESSEAEYCKMLQKIENLDIIKEKVTLLQMNKRYVVNEKQLLQLFSAKCPLCQSKVKTEKVICGVFLVLNQQCLQCDYSKHWKNLNKNGFTAASNDHQTECMEVSLETISTKTVGVAQTVVDEESDHTSEADESSDSGEVMDSDDNWEPEDEPLILESEDGASSCEELYEGATLKHRELCTDCGKFFEKQRPHTCEYKIKPFSCNICGKRCVSDHSLTVHNRVHSVNYRHPCKYCHIGFKTKMDKITHEQTHLNQMRPYKCPHCSEAFATYVERKTHLKSHMDQKELKCSICGIEFLSALALQRHSMVHTGEKPFSCSVCQRGFSQSGHLKSHMRLHTGERPYKCKHCSKGFNHNVSLKSHIKRCHTASGHQQKMRNLGGCVGGDPQGNKGAESGVDRVEESLAANNKPISKFKRKRTGRPIGRPKKNHTGPLTEEEKGSDQGINTKTAKGRKRKPKRRPSSIEEDDEELSQSEESLDLTEGEKQNEKVRSRQKAEDSDFNPTEIKRKRKSSNTVLKSSKSLRGRPRKKVVEEI